MSAKKFSFAKISKKFLPYPILKLKLTLDILDCSCEVLLLLITGCGATIISSSIPSSPPTLINGCCCCSFSFSSISSTFSFSKNKFSFCFSSSFSGVFSFSSFSFNNAGGVLGKRVSTCFEVIFVVVVAGVVKTVDVGIEVVEGVVNNVGKRLGDVAVVVSVEAKIEKKCCLVTREKFFWSWQHGARFSYNYNPAISSKLEGNT